MLLTVRQAEVKDALMIAEISHLTFRHTFEAINSTKDMELFLNEQFTKGKIILEVSDPENTFMLAYADNRIAGYLKLREHRHTELPSENKAIEIARLYCMPGMTGKGVGALLMQTAIQVALEKNKDVLWLGVWEKNHRAIDFYQRWGFEKFGQTDFLLGTDIQLDWLMKKHLHS